MFFLFRVLFVYVAVYVLFPDLGDSFNGAPTVDRYRSSGQMQVDFDYLIVEHAIGKKRYQFAIDAWYATTRVLA